MQIDIDPLNNGSSFEALSFEFFFPTSLLKLHLRTTEMMKTCKLGTSPTLDVNPP